MNTNLLALASGLSDQDLLARIAALAGKEREASVELVAHLAELDTRSSLYAAHGHGSLFTYCTEVLLLSEDAACNRIYAARACRRFPVILDALASGALSLTSVRMLSPHLTPENHEAVLARASGRSRREIEALVAELAPRPDVPSSVRKLPGVAPAAPPALSATAPPPAIEVKPTAVMAPESAPPMSAPAALPAARRPIVETTSPERYRVQFTIGKESHDKLRRVQALLRREIPDGDPGAIFDRAIALLLERVEKEKLGAAKRRASRAIRPGTDSPVSSGRFTSRHTPSHVKRSAWQHDGGQCAFVSKDGRRCTERAFLEFHHVRPYALGGPTSTENISLRCRRHNQYEAELVFGPRTRSIEGDS
jgi:5-methylcytosine-specific restriction endonuclease McrA